MKFNVSFKQMEIIVMFMGKKDLPLHGKLFAYVLILCLACLCFSASLWLVSDLILAFIK